MPRSARSSVSAATKVFVTLPMRKRSSTDASPMAISRYLLAVPQPHDHARNTALDNRRRGGVERSWRVVPAQRDDRHEGGRRETCNPEPAHRHRIYDTEKVTVTFAVVCCVPGLDRSRLDGHRLVGCIRKRLRRAAALDDRGDTTERDAAGLCEHLRIRPGVRDGARERLAVELGLVAARERRAVDLVGSRLRRRRRSPRLPWRAA